LGMVVMLGKYPIPDGGANFCWDAALQAGKFHFAAKLTLVQLFVTPRHPKYPRPIVT